jgi:hypothetical protein
MTLIRIFCCFKTPIRNGFCHSFHRGGGGLMKTNLSFLYMSFSVGGGEGLN